MEGKGESTVSDSLEEMELRSFLLNRRRKGGKWAKSDVKITAIMNRDQRSWDTYWETD